MNFESALNLINNARCVLLTTHIRPDGDAVGSLAALKTLIDRAARHTGRNCATELLFLSRVPDNYQFLLSDIPYLRLGEQITQEQIDAGRLDQYDLFIIADTSTQQQLPGIADYLTKHTEPILVFDHHLATDGLGSCRLINTDAAATGQIIFEFARHACWCVDPQVANALFVALSTDTGWFRFGNASASAYETAAQLVAAGAQPAALYKKLFQDFPPERLKLIALTLQTLELHCVGRLALMQITNQMLRDSGAKRTHIENIINESQQIGSVTVSVLLVEQEDGTTRVSFRSRGPVDVNVIAAQFNGGGHAQAAGATLDLPLNEAKPKILSAISDALST